MPQLIDDNFSKAVVLMVEHNDEGSFGLVINQPSDLEAADLLQALDIGWGGERGAVVWSGGPVMPSTGWVLHTESDQIAGSSPTFSFWNAYFLIWLAILE